MRFRQSKKSKISSVIDMAQLVNIVFLLLVFILLALGVPLGVGGDMDDAQRRTPQAGTATVVVLPGKVLMNGNQADTQDIRKLPKNVEIVVLAFKDTPYSQVAGVLDILRGSGHARISLATKAAPR